ncbi:MFS transporter [Methanobrevibacter sp.]|uniref:MFS transporter n=1 Tax=Methanobrevibacter sp. TaxID=66852 RepID=UPI00318416DF
MGQAIILFGIVLSCISISTEMFFSARILQGIGLAIANVAEIAIIVLAISEENRGKALGIIVSGVYLGTSVSPVVCGFLVQHFGWKSLFLITIFFNTIGLILMLVKVKGEWKTNENDKLDLKGMALYMVGILLFIYGITILYDGKAIILVLLGLMLLVGFGFYELRQKAPAFNVKLFKNHSFTLYNFAGLCGYLAVMAITTIFNYHFQIVRGWNPQITGMIMLISPIVMTITSPNAGKLSDKYHPQKIATVGMLITVFAFAILLFMDKSTPLYIIVIAMVLEAIGMGLFSSPNMNAIMSSIDNKYAAHASASQLTMRAIGQTLSLSLMTLVFRLIMGSLDLTSNNYALIVKSSQLVCIICAVACILAIIVSVVGLKLEKKISF